MRLHDIGPAAGATRARRRPGRGPGSGLGKTAGRGHKGQQSRSGYSRKWYFEGGQMPLVRRVPKRGFHNAFRETFAEVNVGRLGVFEADEKVTPETLVARGLLKQNETTRVKLLGNGEIGVALAVTVHAASESAKKKIEAAGGSVTILGD